MNQLEFEFLWPHRAIQLSLDLDEMNNNERGKYMNQAEYDAERTANGDKRLINLLYQKIELQQAEIEALKERLEETSQLYSKQLVKASEK